VQSDAPAPPPGRVLKSVSEPPETSKAPPTEPAAPSVRPEDTSSLPRASLLPTQSHSIVDRSLDMVLPFRKGVLRREYKGLVGQIAQTEWEIARIERMRDTLSDTDSDLTPSEQSVVSLRSELAGDDLATRREQLVVMRARVTELLSQHADMAPS
jgi:hypothetical protein